MAFENRNLLLFIDNKGEYAVNKILTLGRASYKFNYMIDRTKKQEKGKTMNERKRNKSSTTKCIAGSPINFRQARIRSP